MGETKECNYCKQQISVRADRCPHCTSWIRPFANKNKKISLVIYLVLVVVVFAMLFGGQDEFMNVKKGSVKIGSLEIVRHEFRDKVKSSLRKQVVSE